MAGLMDAMKAGLGLLRSGGAKMAEGGLLSHAGALATGTSRGLLRDNMPLGLVMGYLGTRGTVEGLGIPVAKGIGDMFSTEKTDRGIAETFAMKDWMRSEQLRAHRMQAMKQANIQALSQTNPALYNELLVGRRLPRGAVVIGGAPKGDMLDLVAEGMGSGAFGAPPTPPGLNPF